MGMEFCRYQFWSVFFSTDFFDSSVIPSTSTANEEEDAAKPTAMADILPEGFFDDPKQDAKV
ncbi:hypothetical protein DPMN_101973 [Dreissena polymorpha]|uniref:Uncharacterized protein n=1 Tax=Dreissena polymorpha TaxID=45954 RepID=A0A9D4LM32_DREPO|nr:hypothetical protein DPMN_101973 [Dreissena polymorpha]